MRPFVALASFLILASSAHAETLAPSFDRTAKIVPAVHGKVQPAISDKVKLQEIFEAIGADQTAAVGKQRKCPDDFQLRLLDADSKAVGTIGFCQAGGASLYEGAEYEPHAGKRGAIAVKDGTALQKAIGWPKK